MGFTNQVCIAQSSPINNEYQIQCAKILALIWEWAWQYDFDGNTCDLQITQQTVSFNSANPYYGLLLILVYLDPRYSEADLKLAH